ncbi:MAG: amidohydrolase family protein [Planctomycetota bacterium]
MLKASSWMMVLCAIALLWPVEFGSAAQAGDDETGRPAQDYAVRARRIYVLDKVDYLEDAWMIIRGGKIDSLGTGAIPDADLPVVDFRGASLLPGLVSTESRIFVGADATGMGARYVAADKFNPYANFQASWRHGVTTARLTSPGRRFVSGIGSVVRFGANAEDSTVLVRQADLTVNFNDEAGRGESPDAELVTPSSMDVPYRPAERRRPETRLGRILALETLLRDVRVAKNQDEPSLKLLALGEFLESGRPFRFDAERRGDILQALEAAKRNGLPIYLAGATEAHALVDEIAAAKISVVVDFDNALPDPSFNGFDPVTPIIEDDRTAAVLENRGVRVIIGGHSDDLLMSAALAVKGGMTEGAALRAVTARPADLLGVGDRVGRLKAGMDADFVVINGDPLGTSSRVQQAWVLGSQAWSLAAVDKMPEAVVVRAGKIYDGKGGVYLDAEVLIEDGKVVAVGHRVQRPAYARMHDAGPEAVITPGFIDIHSTLGLEGDSSTVKSDQNLSKLFSRARPEFAAVARAGITTAVVAPGKGSSSGSPIIAIKTQGKNRKELISKAAAGVKLTVRGSGASVLKSLESTLNSADNYHKKWLKYEAELAAFEAAKKNGKLPKAAAPKGKTPPKVSPKPSAEASDALSGTWEATLSGGPMGEPMKLTMRLALEGTDFTGTVTDPFGGSQDAPITGTFDGTTFEAKVEPEDAPFENVRVTAKMTEPEVLKGSVDVDGIFEIDLSAKRTSKGKPKITVKRAVTAVASGPKGPKKPKYSARFEPFRKVLSGKAGIMVAATGAEAVGAVVQAFGKRKLPVVILGGAGAHEVLDKIDGNSVGIAIWRQYTRQDKARNILIPDELDRAGVSPLFQSNGSWGASRLPRFVRAAVREGLNPETALRSLTYDAARLMRMDDSVGSLSRGCDGDLLIFDGEPFDARTSLVEVLIRGKEVQ